jgi:hypothetical protein
VVAWEGGLVGYVAGEAEPASLRAHLEARLPGYMVPAPIVRLPALPRNAGGKVDRRALPEPAVTTDEMAPPVGDTECALAALWSELLGTPTVGRDSHFFALGGHSLLAARLQARIHTRFRVVLPLHLVFEAPTLAGLAAAIDAACATDSETTAIRPLRRERRGRAKPIAHARPD